MRSFSNHKFNHNRIQNPSCLLSSLPIFYPICYPPSLSSILFSTLPPIFYPISKELNECLSPSLREEQIGWSICLTSTRTYDQQQSNSSSGRSGDIWEQITPIMYFSRKITGGNNSAFQRKLKKGKMGEIEKI